MKKVTKATIAAVAAETGHLNLTNYSYINHLVTNGRVINCSFDDPNDQQAAGILAADYPGRQVVGVDARELFARGGGIHCLTQQLPAAAREQAAS
ncbi:agmatine/peptidylarginine deiminase [Glutamicibacter nicotianae]|nr:agmatine/peptidylarginine deiminase [Glutamicibacter nicotianae]